MNEMETQLTDFLTYFETHGRDETVLRCVYIYGGAGCGKTTFASTVLKKNNYDFISYTAGDLRNKTIIEALNIYNMACSNVMSSFLNGGKGAPRRKLAVLMDEIECMNTGDKGGINALIKLVRPKRTKKQKLDDTTYIPIICIGNLTVDKKITELMKCSLVLQMPAPSEELRRSILAERLCGETEAVHESVLCYAGGDLNKLSNMCNIIRAFGGDVVRHFERKKESFDTKQIALQLLRAPLPLKEHADLSEPDRTIVAMLWHENVADHVSGTEVYGDILEKLCFADFIDRATFQKQIWQFNEMSSVLKTFYANTDLHRSRRPNPPKTVRFTKILTKYSTEYNNAVFVQRLCQDTGLDKSDLLTTVTHLRQTRPAEEITRYFDVESITAVDISRLLRFLDKLRCPALAASTDDD